MRVRGVALSILLILTALLSACAPLPGLPAPTAAPAIASPVASPAGPTEISPTPTAPLAATVAVTSPVTLSVTAAITPTIAAAETPAAPEVTAAAPVTATVAAQSTEPAPALTTYRDEFAGYEIDYPAAWWLIDVTPEIKQQSLGYSVTFMSWQPQEPGTEGIPEGGSKVDLSVAKGSAASPEAALESRREELAQAEFPGQITFEEPWELAGGLPATRLTVQTSRGETYRELVTAINGNSILLTGLGDPALFEQIAMTLRPLGASVETLGGTLVEAAQAAETPIVQAQEAVTVPATSALAAPALAVPEVAPAALTAGATVYTVQRGDTLNKIAARFGVTVAAILRANPQITNPDRIYIGQRITIPTDGTQPPSAGTTRVNISMIGIGSGNVGCGDQVVAVRRDVPKTAAPLTAALNLLLSEKSQFYGESGLFNALWQSNLSIGSITRSGTSWTIRLTGTLQLSGVCDNPRVKAQLEQTALQFSTVKSVRYFINGQPLDTVLSGK